jgi:hypothetical protein
MQPTALCHFPWCRLATTCWQLLLLHRMVVLLGQRLRMLLLQHDHAINICKILVGQRRLSCDAMLWYIHQHAAQQVHASPIQCRHQLH